MISNNITGPDDHDFDEDDLEFQDGDFDDDFDGAVPEHVTEQYDKDDEEIWSARDEEVLQKFATKEDAEKIQKILGADEAH